GNIGVSQPTVARFCLALGFTGFKEFKLRLVQSLAGGVPFVHRAVGAGDRRTPVQAAIGDVARDGRLPAPRAPGGQQRGGQG
ncbi:hypothetical protein EO238_31700, partial [Citrobacter sp. AAK_AS5]